MQVKLKDFFGRQPLWICILIFAALALRVGMFFSIIENPELTIDGDTGSYRVAANALIETGSYTFPGALRTPLYPMFIALIRFPNVDNAVSVVFGQILLNALTIYTAFQLGLKLKFSQNEALLGALLLSVSLESLLTTFLVLTETLFTFLSTLSLYYLTVYCLEKRRMALVISALTMSLGILCRPAGLIFPLAAIVIIMIWGHSKLSQRIVSGLIFTSLVALPLIPWVLRNNYETGIPTISTIQNYNLLFYNAASLQADEKGIPLAQVQDGLFRQIKTRLAEVGLPDTDANRDHLYASMGREMIMSNLPRYVYVHLKYDLRNFLPGLGYAVRYLGTSTGSLEGWDVFQYQGMNAVMSNYFGEKKWIIVFLLPFVALLAITYIGSMTSMVKLLTNRQWFAFFILFVTIGYFMLLPGAPSNSRFRVPAMPFIALTAGHGLSFLAVKLKTILNAKKSALK